MKFSFLIACIASALSLGAAEFDPGGTAFDFAEISNRRFLTSSTGKNLFGEWRKSPPWVHLRDGRLANELRPKITPLVEFSKENTSDGVLLKTVKKKEIEEIAGSSSSSISGSWQQTVRFPDSAGGQYRLSFQYHSVQTGKYGMSGFIVLSFKSGKNVKTEVKTFSVGSGTWQNYVTDINVPVGYNAMDIYLRLDGCGEILFKNPLLEKVTAGYPAAVILAPGALLDNTFALSQKDPAVLTFAWKRNVPKDQWKLSDPVLHVVLPPEIKLEETGAMLSLKSHENGEYRISLRELRGRLANFDSFDAHLLLSMMITTDAAPGTELPSASYWLTDAGKQISEKREFRFLVIPQIQMAGKSRLYLNGFYPMGLYLDFKNKESREKWAEFAGRTGSRWLVGNPDSGMMELYRKYGISMITPELYWVANGYRIGNPEGKPEYAKYKAIGKTSSFDIQNGTCPVAIYKKTDYFTGSIVPYLKRSLEGADGLIANWEPFMFHGMGCFCGNCRDEFAEYAKLSKDDVEKAWPQELLINRRYYDIGVRFRSWQHARMVKAIHEAVNGATTGKAGFIPEVAWIQMVDCEARKSAAGEHDPLDYAGDLKYIDPWGPYICWKSLEPYTYAKGDNLNTYIAAKQVVDFTRKKFPAGKRPKLLALPHGMQSSFWLANPENIAMEVLGFFLAGYNASTVYLFPKGYDNRYWAALAQANSLIAENENMVCKGERTDSVSVTPLTPYPAPKKRINSRYFSDLPPESLLQTAAFRKDGILLAAVGNFWERGDVFFTLRIKGLKQDGRYLVRELEKKRCFGGQGKTFFTGAELAQGVTLHAGALRWAFFEIMPWKAETAGGKMISQDTVSRAMRERLPVLKRAAGKEAERDAAEDRDFQKSELKSITSGELKCNPVRNSGGAQALEFTSGKNSLRLTLNGMAVQSWKLDGNEWIAGTKSSGLGAPAFWLPPVQPETPFLVKEQKACDSGIRITAEKTLNRKISPALEHLTIRQTLEVSRNLEKITIRTELINMHDSESGMGSVTAGFRYHILPLCLGKGGSLEMKSGGQSCKFRRTQERMIFARGATESAMAMKKLFEAPRAPVMIDDNILTWRMPETEMKVRMSVEPAGAFAGFACWDTPNLETPTFEPFFLPVTLKAGESAGYTLTLTAGK